MKKTMVVLLICCATLATWASGGQEDASDGRDVLEISVSYSNQPGEPVDRAVRYWADLVAERSGGAIVLTPFPSGQLGGQETVQQQAQMGANIIAISDYGSLADLVPDLGVIIAPYVGTSVEQKLELLRTDRFQDLIGQLDDQGYHVLVDDFYYGTRQLLTNRRVTTPEEMNGVKIRVQNLKIANYWALSVGAVPTPMPLSEAYTAMSQGIVEGIENPPATLYGGKFHELAQYLILTNHNIHMTPWVVGTAFWESLSDEEREILTTTGAEMAAYATELIASSEGEYIDLLAAEGVEVVEVDTAPFLANALAVMEGNFPEWSEGLYEETLNSLR
ncbi:MAG: C4-dicarboxylate TRAP transporter substrate-binding protein [Spirochaetales bacterium]|nr:C4-dicarboxylate TRAP transporter substrate-binding protein [Spirochaetales bacterium]